VKLRVDDVHCRFIASLVSRVGSGEGLAWWRRDNREEEWTGGGIGDEDHEKADDERGRLVEDPGGEVSLQQI
jgi:hypothetical protein